MAVGDGVLPELAAVSGVRLAVASAGIKVAGRMDVVLLELAPGSEVAAVFTTNAFCAAPVIGDEPFAVLLADDLMVGSPPVLQQMVEQFSEWRASILAVQEVPAEHTRRYGIVAGHAVGERMIDITEPGSVIRRACTRPSTRAVW